VRYEAPSHVGEALGRARAYARLLDEIPNRAA
jgi:hypothetical protein